MRRKKAIKPSFIGVYAGLIGLFVMIVGITMMVLVVQNRIFERSIAAPSAELLTDRANLSFTSGAYTSQYHLYAAGIDYSKPVGMLLFGDGSGESGFSKPTSNYQMGGPTGLIAVAKKHNMILLYPASPNRECQCWDEGDSAGYSQWAEALVTQVQSQYQIDKRRVAVGGYSSGAYLASGRWIPSGAAQRTMDDGVVVLIGMGASGRSATYTPAFKSNVHLYWNVGDQDEFLEQSRSSQTSYASQGFQTSIDILPGVTHERSGEFGPIMDAQITKHVIPASGPVPSSAAPSGSAPPPSNVSPTYFCGGSVACVPSNSPIANPTSGSSMPMPNTTGAPTISGEPPIIEISGTPGTNPPSTPNIDPKNNQGLLGLLLGFILLILQFFAELFS